MRVSILHDEAGVVVVDKPPGLEATGRTRDDPGGVEHHLATQLRRRVWAVHQLDRDTSGALVFVRKRSLVAPWQGRLAGATKRYLAIAHGRVAPQTVDAPLAYDRGLRRWVIRDGGKPAVTELRVLDARDDASLVEARPRTGRTHQVRVHLASRGHPLFGESRHREPPCDAHPRHALHLWRIELNEAVFESSLPADLKRLAARLDLRVP